MAISLVLGIDAGLNAVKIIGPKGELMFRSFIWRKPPRMVDFGEAFESKDRFELTFKDKTYLLGEDAYNTTRFSGLPLNEYSANGSKNTSEALIRAIGGICRYVDKYEDKAEDEIDIYFTYGSPILVEGAEDEGELIKSKFRNNGEPFMVTYNDRELNINVKEIGIVKEGIAAYLSNENLLEEDSVYIVDPGSMTVNLAAIIDRRPVRTGAGTLTNGVVYYKEQYGEDLAAETLAADILNKIKGLKWIKGSKIYVCGGYAEELMAELNSLDKDENPYTFEILEAEVYFGSRKTPKKLPPIYANAAGLFNVAKQTFSVKG